MGHRCTAPDEKAGESPFRIMEVVMLKKSEMGIARPTSQMLTVDNQWETLRYVQEHMDEIIGTMVRVNRMETSSRRKIEDNARLFEKNLEPLFSLISATSKENLMDKLSSSLKKALLLMALDRYHCDRETISRALGISKEKLEKEMKACGL
jgi:DNA-binding NtrC family response regulator